jgi:diphthamide biosynthesis protein 4
MISAVCYVTCIIDKNASGAVKDLGFPFSFVSSNDNVLAAYKHTNKEAVLNRSMTYMPTYYEILGLPKALHHEPHLPAQTLRTAYRRALLQNHPDKVIKCTSATEIEKYSIDQITKAFSTLSNGKLRGAYDKELKLQQTSLNVNGLKGKENFYTGIETVDLDDLGTNEAEGIWFRFCRCGDDQGFLIREADLEEAVDDGEISVGCRGCSLWLKVLFGVMEDTQGQDAAG